MSKRIYSLTTVQRPGCEMQLPTQLLKLHCVGPTLKLLCTKLRILHLTEKNDCIRRFNIRILRSLAQYLFG